jgi:hypothetical protein
MEQTSTRVVLNKKPDTTTRIPKVWRESSRLLAVLLLAGLLLPYSTVAAPQTPPARSSYASASPAEVGAAVRLAEVGFQLGSMLPDLLGLDGERTYLVLFQNNHELRGTGGFITAVGEVGIANGRIARIDIHDSYLVDRHDVNHPTAPEPMRRYMNIELMFLRDVNWSPDLATTAQLARFIYKQDTGKQIDGLITVDLRAAELLVDALAPLLVDGLNEPVTAENFLNQFIYLRNHSGATDTTTGALAESDRKDFIALIAQSIIARVMEGDFSYFQIANALYHALNERAIQVWLANSDAAQVLAEMQWDGSIRPEPGADYLALVDTNLGHNKVDYLLRRRIDYKIDWPADPAQPGQATVTLHYEHPLVLQEYVCLNVAPYQEHTYQEMLERCHYDYLRLYVPKGSRLQSMTGVEEDSIRSYPGEGGAHVFAGFFILRPGESHTVTISYTLPSTIRPEEYRLVVQRQAGAAPYPFTVQVGDHRLNSVLTHGRITWQP